MREVILIVSYTPDEERLEIMINTVNFFHSCGKDIILVTHSTNTPEFIQKKCKYYLYSSENKLVDSEESRIFIFRETNDLLYGSKLIHKHKYTTLAIYNMIYLGSTIAKSLGYEMLHYVEYDGNFKTLDLIDFSSQKIKEGNDGVLITHEDGEIHGAYLALNLNSYNYYDLVFNEGELEKKSIEHVSTERLTRDYFFGGKKVYLLPYSEIELYGYRSSTYSHTSCERNYFVFPAFFDGKVQIVHDNQNQEEEDLMVILNDSQIFKYKTPHGNFRIFPICKYEDLEKIILLINGEVIFTYILDSEELKEEMFSKSIIRRK